MPTDGGIAVSRRYAWAVLAGAGVVLEAVSLRRHDGCTLSETWRAVFRTHTPAGRAFTVGFLSALPIVLVPHLLKRVPEAIAAVLEDFDIDRPNLPEIEETAP